MRSRGERHANQQHRRLVEDRVGVVPPRATAVLPAAVGVMAPVAIAALHGCAGVPTALTTTVALRAE